MDGRPAVRSAVASERTIAMAEMRRCIGSERFGIEPHDAPVADFPKQLSQKDGLGRMCKTHWNQYTKALARDAAARKAAAGTTEPATSEGEATTIEGVAPATEPSAKR